MQWGFYGGGALVESYWDQSEKKLVETLLTGPFIALVGLSFFFLHH